MKSPPLLCLRGLLNLSPRSPCMSKAPLSLSSRFYRSTGFRVPRVAEKLMPKCGGCFQVPPNLLRFPSCMASLPLAPRSLSTTSTIPVIQCINLSLVPFLRVMMMSLPSIQKGGVMISLRYMGLSSSGRLLMMPKQCGKRVLWHNVDLYGKLAIVYLMLLSAYYHHADLVCLQHRRNSDAEIWCTMMAFFYLFYLKGLMYNICLEVSVLSCMILLPIYEIFFQCNWSRGVLIAQ